MAFKMAVSNDKLEGKDAVPAGLYKLRFVSFAPKFSALKPGEPEGTIKSLNYNAKMEIIDNPEVLKDGPRYVYEGLNENAGWILQDWCHALGFPMETDGKASWFPGDWEGEEGKAETYKYNGPLTGQVMEAEVAITVFNGKDVNKVRRYLCAIKDCAQKFPKIQHSKDLLKKK